MRPRILIFEDNESLLSTLKFVLGKQGYEVMAYTDPKMCQAFDSIDLTCPADFGCADVIISDIHMPTTNGLDLIKERQQKGCKVKYRALMSADWTDSDLKSASELDCHVFHKPFDLKEMLGWLNDCREEIIRERISVSAGSAGDMEKTTARNRPGALQRAADW